MPEIFYSDEHVTLWHGDCLDVLATIPDASIDAVVTDPPYGLEFMGKGWDAPWAESDVNADAGFHGGGISQTKGLPSFTGSTNPKCLTCKGTRRGRRDGTAKVAVCLCADGGKFPNVRATEMRAFGMWCEQWATECLRVLKPGGMMLSFGGTRTWHRLACAIEDAGFEIRDSIAWLYGSGFPKSLDVSKAIDKGSGENRARQLEFTAWMRATGITAAQINAATGTNMGGHYLTDASQPAIATADMFDKLRPLLPEVPERIERLVAERTGVEWPDYVKRHKVGEKRSGIAVPGEGQRYTVGGSKSVTVDVTAAYSDAARQWQGWGTALKPAFEPIVVARKPLAGGAVAANVLEWGCGAININACRVGSTSGSSEGSSSQAGTRGCAVHGVRGLRHDRSEGEVGSGTPEVAEHMRPEVPRGADARPAESELAGRLLDRQEVGIQARRDGQPAAGGSSTPARPDAAGVPGAPSSHGPEGGQVAHGGRDGASHQRSEGRQSAGEPAPDRLGGTQQGTSADRARTSGVADGERPTPGCTCGTSREATRVGESSADRRYTDKGGTNFAPLPGVRGGSSAGRWPTNVALDDTQADELDGQSGVSTSRVGKPRGSDAGDGWGMTATGAEYADAGGASRFFPTFRYEAKASRSERPRVNGTAHPTVKPIDLMRWLVRLVTPPGGTVLEPFAGSGTTVEACIIEGFRCVAIEREADYLPLIEQRIHRRRDPVAALRLAGDDLGLFDSDARRLSQGVLDFGEGAS